MFSTTYFFGKESNMTAARSFDARFQVYYRSLRREHTEFAFPCDEEGRVEG